MHSAFESLRRHLRSMRKGKMFLWSKWYRKYPIDVPVAFSAQYSVSEAIVYFSPLVCASLAYLFTPHMGPFAILVTLQSTCSNLSRTNSQLLSPAWSSCPWQLTFRIFRPFQSVTFILNSYCQQFFQFSSKPGVRPGHIEVHVLPAHCRYSAEKN